MADVNAIPDIPTVPYFLVLLVPSRNIAAAERHFADHVAFIETMEAANVVLLGGEFETPVGDAEAAYLLHTLSKAEAEAWAAKDPLVTHDAYRAKIVTWNLVGIAPGAIAPAFKIA